MPIPASEHRWSFSQKEVLGGTTEKRRIAAQAHRLTAMPNIFRPTFEDEERPEGFRSRRARVGYELGTELIGASLWEIPPGEVAYPYHFHYSDEELVIVLSGRPSLRTPEGLRELEEGEALRFPLGEEGAHQIVNRTDEAATFLAISKPRSPGHRRLPGLRQDRRRRAPAQRRRPASVLPPR